MKNPSQNNSGHVNKDSGAGSDFHPLPAGIPIHITPESLFTWLRNEYSHRPEYALEYSHYSESAVKVMFTAALSVDGKRTLRIGPHDFSNSSPVQVGVQAASVQKFTLRTQFRASL